MNHKFFRTFLSAAWTIYELLIIANSFLRFLNFTFKKLILLVAAYGILRDVNQTFME